MLPLFFLLLTICRAGSEPTYLDEYRTNYAPKFVDTKFGPQIVAPDTPYVAAGGRKELYFIDTRHDPETAQKIKDNVEWASVSHPDDYISIDEIEATAAVKNSKTDETLFTFDPEYAKLLFAVEMNRLNPSLNLPEYEPEPDTLVTYDVGGEL